MPLIKPSRQSSQFAGWSWVSIWVLWSGQKQGGRGDAKTPADHLAIVRFYDFNIWHLWHINKKSEGPKVFIGYEWYLLHLPNALFHLQLQPSYSHNFYSLTLIGCLPHSNSWLVDLSFQKILSMCPSSSMLEFTSPEELNCCVILPRVTSCLTILILPFPCHPPPPPWHTQPCHGWMSCWSLPNSKHHFLASHVPSYQSCFPLSSHNSLHALPLSLSLLPHTSLKPFDLIPSPQIC